MNPLQIKVMDQGQPRKAIFWETAGTPVEHTYRVQFEDGYDQVFFFHYKHQDWCEEGVGLTALAKKVGAAISMAYQNVLQQCLFN